MLKRFILFAAIVCLPLLPGVAAADECVELDLELTPTAGPDSAGITWVEFSAELTNCGTERCRVQLTVELNAGLPVPPVTFYISLNAGQTAARSRKFPVPPNVPPGTYEVCATATCGAASSSDCASVTIE